MSDAKPVGDVRDDAGYPDIGALGAIGNGCSVALIAADGGIDWWALPNLDSPPPFAALLDPEAGGRIELCPTDPDAEVTCSYLPHTNLLVNEFITPRGRARVIDSLNSGNAGALPWTELARRIEGLDGEVELRFAVRPGTGLGCWEPWVDADGDVPILHAGDVVMAVRASDGIELRSEQKAVEGTLTIRAGERLLLAVVATAGEPLYLPDVESIDTRMDLTAENWRHWSTQVAWDGAGRERIVRSALALKVLTMAQSGAIAAAATTSLPEKIGGSKNWDYRLAWVRDAAMTVDAYSTCGLQEEVHAAVAWLLDAIRRNGPDVHVMYQLDGSMPDDSWHADVPGYRDSQPVMIGNDAAGQLQLGVYGDLFGTVANWVFGGHVLDVGTAREIADLADRCADTWRHDDCGIWELPQIRPYTLSKMNCWRALDAAARLAEAGHLTGTGSRWRGAAAEIRRWVQENCWSASKNAYSFYAGSDELDAAVLLGAQFGFDTGKRMSTTVDAVLAELGDGPLVYRYSGVSREEETFLACAYWTVSALARVGRLDEARQRLEQLNELSTPLGLLSEMCVPGSNEMVGNFPQALSHLAHISATAIVREVSESE